MPTPPTLICIHGIADEGNAFAALSKTSLADKFEILQPDLPGFGGAGAVADVPLTINACRDFILKLMETASPRQRVGLVGHSIGAAIAVAVALSAPSKVCGVFSVEGNLTEADAFLSGKAANFDDPTAFKTEFVAFLSAEAKSNPSIARYLTAARKADAQAMWSLGRDVVVRGAGHQFGAQMLSLNEAKIPHAYYWGRHNTAECTRDWIDCVDAGAFRSIEFTEAGHWPFIDDPAETARTIQSFFAPLL